LRSRRDLSASALVARALRHDKDKWRDGRGLTLRIPHDLAEGALDIDPSRRPEDREADTAPPIAPPLHGVTGAGFTGIEIVREGHELIDSKKDADAVGFIAGAHDRCRAEA
jgi:hypothetical protein